MLTLKIILWVVDAGENIGLRLGDKISVFRDADYVASLEIIQLRKDISAADIKEQRSPIQVGDSVR